MRSRREEAYSVAGPPPGDRRARPPGLGVDES